MNCLVTVCISFILAQQKNIFSGYFIKRISGTIKRFWCIRYETNIEVKIRDCPGAFGTDGGSGVLARKKLKRGGGFDQSIFVVFLATLKTFCRAPNFVFLVMNFIYNS